MPPIIVGAGPAGCAGAIALAHAGVEPVLLDRDAEPRDQLCGGFLSWRTAAQVRELGVEPAHLGARKVDRLALFAGDRTVTLPLPGPSFGLSRRALDTALRARALALGARLAVEHVRCIDGIAVLGRGRRWQGEGLFLATGKHDLRGHARPRRAADPALGLRLRLPATAARTALLPGRIELHLFDRGYAGIVLQEDGTANVCLAVRKSLLGRAGGEPSELLARLGDGNPLFALRLGDDWTAAAIETIGSVPYGWLAREADPGVFRLGDQAAVIPSLAGEGISIALASGASAARHWLARRGAGARDYQREIAARAAPAMRAAKLAWWLAEGPASARAGIALARRCPPVLALLMQLSRIPPERVLAQAGGAP